MNTRLFRTPAPTPDEKQADTEIASNGAGILWAVDMARAERSCCCPAKPAVVAVLSGASGKPTDLLLCRHHFNASRYALEAAHAEVYDTQGEVVTTGDVQIP